VGVVELEAAAALYTGATLEQVEPFTLVDRLVELWLARGLPIGTSGASSALDRYWLHRNDRLSDEQRRGTYARVFDARFDELWMALVEVLAQPEPAAAARRHADAVRAHLGACVDEKVLALTPLLYAQLRAALDVLGDREILATYGAQDIWQLIDQRARLDLGATPDVARVRTMAAAGAEIIAWLAADDDAVSDEAADAARSWLAVARATPPGA
jgi:hypothetical protein